MLKIDIVNKKEKRKGINGTNEKPKRGNGPLAKRAKRFSDR